MIKICGLDEVGRGAFAGPLVAASVVVGSSIKDLIANSPVPIRDSKTLSHSQRLRVARYLVNRRIKFYLAEISVEEINTLGMAWANREIFLRLIAKNKANRFIVDGNLKLTLPNYKIESRVKADRDVLQVRLASILAKLHRDKIMRRLHRQYPVYNWLKNKGYGTSEHLKAIHQFGPCPLHRQLWLKTWQSHTLTN